MLHLRRASRFDVIAALSQQIQYEKFEGVVGNHLFLLSAQNDGQSGCQNVFAGVFGPRG